MEAELLPEDVEAALQEPGRTVGMVAGASPGDHRGPPGDVLEVAVAGVERLPVELSSR